MVQIALLSPDGLAKDEDAVVVLMGCALALQAVYCADPNPVATLNALVSASVFALHLCLSVSVSLSLSLHLCLSISISPSLGMEFHYSSILKVVGA